MEGEGSFMDVEERENVAVPTFDEERGIFEYDEEGTATKMRMIYSIHTGWFLPSLLHVSPSESNCYYYYYYYL